jgi:flagellar protein FlbD
MGPLSDIQVPDRVPMIQLTRLNNQGLLVNSDLIKFVETAPDTVLTLVSGEKIVVRESADAVLDKIIQFRRLVLGHDRGALPDLQPTSFIESHPGSDDSVARIRNQEPQSTPEGKRGPERG